MTENKTKPFPRGKRIEAKCIKCGDVFSARVADRKRGWGNFCSKSCKAKEQEDRTGQYSSYIHRQDDRQEDFGHPLQSGYFGHGQY